MFIPNGKIRSTYLKVGIKKRHKTKWVDSVEYMIAKLPKPIIAIGNNTEERISTKDAISAMVINAFADESFPICFKATVTGYTFALKSDSTEKTYFENVNGNKITESIRQKLKETQTGDNIIIAQVEYTINKSKHLHNGRQFYIYNKPGAEKIKPVQPEEIIFYQNKTVKFQFKNNLADSTGSYIYFFENGDNYMKGNYLINDNFTLAVDDSAYLGDNYFSMYREVDKCLFGYQEAFYKNGKLREAGNFDTSYSYLEQVACFMSRPDMEDRYNKHVYSVRHGLWKFYDEKGNLIRQTVYDKGHIKDE